MGISKLNIWVSEVDNPCGTWNGKGTITIMDCDGILKWRCGRFLSPKNEWVSISSEGYLNLPFKCGHLEVELPPGCYWVLAGTVTVQKEYFNLNYATHVGIVSVGCDDNACVKLFNPSKWLCWNWFRVGIRAGIASGQLMVDQEKFAAFEKNVHEILKDVPRSPIDDVIVGVFDGLVEKAKERTED